MSGMSGGDYPIAAFADLLEDAILFTGYNGDNAWSLSATPDMDAARREYRVQHGGVSPADRFLPRADPVHRGAAQAGDHRHLPQRGDGPLQRRRELRRPIARRLLEEAGVPRHVRSEEASDGFGLLAGAGLPV